uniref:Uncharacterized protein n=1 Tax=Nitratidesulfovibrio vulgaris (strain DSM 19637 / Miyazaki F) TaxID=883 RepID=B8DLX9_NITV9
MQMFGRFHFFERKEAKGSPVPSIHAYFEFLHEDRPEFWFHVKGVGSLRFKQVRRTLYELTEARPEVGPLPRGGGLSQREIEWLREQWGWHAGGYTTPTLDFSGLRRALRTLKLLACGRGPRPNCGGSSALHHDGV